MDPIAKACIPAIYQVWLDSDEYWLTVEDPHRLMFNMIYRLDYIYDKSFDVYKAYEIALLHSDDPEQPYVGIPRKQAIYVMKFRELGE